MNGTLEREQGVGVRATEPFESPDMAGLAEALSLFAESTNRLEEAYRNLQARAEAIDRELTIKNAELERANEALTNKFEELDRTRRYLDSVIESMANGLISVTVDGRILTANGAAERILRRSREDMAGILEEGWLGEKFQRCFGSVLAEGNSFDDIEGSLLDADGRRIPVRASISPIATRAGACLGVLFIFEDMTRIRLLEERIRRTDRLTALGELAAGVAHEMRNPLTTIRGFVQILPRQSGDPEFLNKLTSNVLREIDRLASLTGDLLDFAKPVGTELSLEDPTQLLQEVVGFHLDSRSENGLRAEQVSSVEGLFVRVDRNRIKQVLLNIVINALDAVGEPGLIRYGTDVVMASLKKRGEEEKFVVISIADNGAGISEENLSRVFDPFFTTKDKGTGLGLALSHRIIEEHGGLIEAESEKGKGTEFRVYLPAVEEETAS